MALVVSWLSTLALGRTPSGLHSFIAGYLVYSTRVSAYVGLLAIPALIFAGVLGMVGQVIAFLGWFVCIVIGRMPKGMRDLGAYCMRFSAQTNTYAYLLTHRYPTLASP